MTGLRFEQPAMLLLAIAAVPLIAFGWRSLGSLDRTRRVTALALRTVLLLALTAILAGPRFVRTHDHLTVIGLLDISGSVQRFADLPEIAELNIQSNMQYLRHWFREATETKAPDDRFGLVVFDGRAIALSAPSRRAHVDDNLDVSIIEGTNIAEAIRLGLAMFPPDTARRLVLVSDGNETMGDALAAARQAAGSRRTGSENGTRENDLGPGRASVPIDVVPISYYVAREVQVVRIEAPPNARPEQTVTLRIMLEATAPTTGDLVLLHEDVPVDLNGATEGTARRVALPAGQSVQLAQVRLGDVPVNRFVAAFEPVEPAADQLADNNRAEAFTVTPTRGAVLVLASDASRESAFVTMLREANLPVESSPAELLSSDLLTLTSYDLIVLENVPAYELSPAQQEMLARYVTDLGGGLIMTGGENSFGAGGWNGTVLEAVLPLELDPPRELRLPRAALALVLDKSGSMRRSVAGALASQQEVANEGAALAIESLRAESLIGVITFDFSPHVHVPLQPNDDPAAIAARVRGIVAEGGTAIAPALRLAYDMLAAADVDRRHIVLLSDGQSPESDLQETIGLLAAANIKVTTIAVGDDADHQMLQRIADSTGGEFYPVRNPRLLPRVLVDSVQVINKPLIKEVPFTPVVRATGSTLTAGMDRAPALTGLVVTAPRPDPLATIEMTDPDGVPLLAHWQAGLGRVAAFTSAADGDWAQNWLAWPGYASFWTQLARTIARPPGNQEARLLATIDDDRLHIVLEALDREEGFLDALQVQGRVYQPDGEAVPVRLRQVGPGRYEGSVAAPLAGNYIVALNPRRGTRALAPVIGGASRSMSAEFRHFQSNLGLLGQIVELTDGRRLSVEQPAEAALFDRAGMPVSVSLLPIWRLLLWAALALMLLDVACRRIAWSAAGVRRAVQRATSRVTAPHARGVEAAATLASLRSASTRLEQSLDAHSKEVTKMHATGRIASPPERDLSDRAPGAAPPEPSRVSAALNALLGRRAIKQEQPAPKSAPPQPDTSTGSTETTTGLLAAKRRARDQLKPRE